MTLEQLVVRLPNGLELPVVVQGDPAGPAVVLLHGLADSWRVYARVLEHLPGSIRAIVPTQRGHGDAGRPHSGYGVREFAEDAVALMEELGVEDAVLGGHSSHSIVVQRIAIDRPERTRGLILIGSPARPGRNPRARRYWDESVSKLTDPIDPGFVRDFVRSTLVKPVPEAFFEAIVAESLKAPAAVWKATFLGLLEERVSGERARIAAPALVVWGDRDAISPRSDQDAIVAEIPDARLVVYPGAGHSPHLEEPALLAADIAAFAAAVAD